MIALKTLLTISMMKKNEDDDESVDLKIERRDDEDLDIDENVFDDEDDLED